MIRQVTVRMSRRLQKLATVHRAMRGQDFQCVFPPRQYLSCLIYELEILPRIEFAGMRGKNGPPQCFRENRKLVKAFVALCTDTFDRRRTHRDVSIRENIAGLINPFSTDQPKVFANDGICTARSKLLPSPRTERGLAHFRDCEEGAVEPASFCRAESADLSPCSRLNFGQRDIRC